jgi:hypothetical protein
LLICTEFITYLKIFSEDFSKSARRNSDILKAFEEHIVSHLYLQSQKQNAFIFQQSLLNDWFGLSWAGRMQLSNNLPKSTYRVKKLELVKKIEKESQVIMKDLPIILLWMDNFCEVYKKGYGFQSSGNFSMDLWKNLKFNSCYCKSKAI